MKHLLTGIIVTLLILSVADHDCQATEPRTIISLLDATAAFTDEWGKSRDLIKAIVEELGPGDEFILNTVPGTEAQDEKANLKVRREIAGSMFEQMRIKGDLKAAIDKLKPEPSEPAADIGGALTLAHHEVRRSRKGPLLFLFVDLTKAKLNVDVLAGLRFNPGSEIYCFSIPYRDENTYVGVIRKYAEMFKVLGFIGVTEDSFFSTGESSKRHVVESLKRSHGKR